MNKKCIVVLKLAEKIIYNKEYDYVGVDKGALTLANLHIPMIYAVGDFDSIEKDDLNIIKEYTNNLEVLNPIKDDSDSEHAIKKVYSLEYEEIIVYGGLGGRLDHEIVNIKLCEKYPNKLIFVGEDNRLRSYKEGEYTFNKEYTYISLFAYEDSEVSWMNTKYLLDHATLKTTDLYGLSNEIEIEPAKLIVHKGKVLVIESNDKKRFPL